MLTSIEFYHSSRLINNTQSQFKRMKNTSNINLNQLITPCKPPACSNTTTHHKTNFQYHKYRVLQVFKSNKILFVTSNQKYLFTFARNKKHSQYVFKPPYNTMQATRLLQHNDPPHIQFPTSQV